MASLLYRLGRTAYRRWYVFITAWLLLIAMAGFAASTWSKPMVDSFTIPGIKSLEAQELQEELFPAADGDTLEVPTVTVVVQAPEGETLEQPENSQAVDALIADLRDLPQMPSVEESPQLVNPVPAAAGQFEQSVQAAVEAGTPRPVAEANAQALLPLSEDGRTGTMTWAFDAAAVTDVEPETVEALQDLLDEQNADTDLRVEANGTGFQQFPEIGGTSELLGIAVAGVVLLITFGSMVAAGLPILSALVGVALGTLGIQIATAFTDIGTTTPVLATMIGLAVGIDYTLFILSRYRSELKRQATREDAVAMAVGTAGSAVVFAGLTVLIALSMLFVVGIPFLTSMGLAAGATVFTAVLVALTLLPAVLGVLGSKAFGGRIRRQRVELDDDGRTINNGVRWARGIARRPIAVVVLVIIGLGALALPAANLRLALPSDSTAPTNTTQRQASDLIAEGFGAGREAPLLVVVDARGIDGANPQQTAGERQAAFGSVVEWTAGQKDVANAQIVSQNSDGTGATVLVTPASGPDDQATTALLEELRDGTSTIEEETGTTVGVTGLTAIQADVSNRLTEALPTYLAVVIGLAFVLLMVVFRSVLVPLTATLGFLLSVLATFGATVLVFQEGLFGLVDGQPLVSFLPIILIGIVFGLAMDYQVFLVSRMREMYVSGDSAAEAVEDGFRHGARVVAAAAAIMIAVFGAFMLQSDALIQSMGFALAVAVLFDAFVVRMTLIPAVMYLLGDRAWWLPGWLDRLLPAVDIEGERLKDSAAAGYQPKHRAETTV